MNNIFEALKKTSPDNSFSTEIQINMVKEFSSGFSPLEMIIVQYGFLSFWFPGSLPFGMLTFVLSVFHFLDVGSQIVLILLNSSIGEVFTDLTLQSTIGKYVIYTVISLMSSYLVMIPWVGSPMVMMLGFVQYINYDK